MDQNRSLPNFPLTSKSQLDQQLIHLQIKVRLEPNSVCTWLLKDQGWDAPMCATGTHQTTSESMKSHKQFNTRDPFLWESLHKPVITNNGSFTRWELQYKKKNNNNKKLTKQAYSFSVRWEGALHFTCLVNITMYKWNKDLPDDIVHQYTMN